MVNDRDKNRSGAVLEFPNGFLWGAATAAHQVEGNNFRNDWWAHEEQGDLPFRSGEACNHFECYAEDFDLAKDWSHNAHRLSIEWSRIEPQEGVWDTDAIDHYASVIEALRARNMEPLVTLHHFTNPLWFSRSGGWLRRDSTQLFSRYVARVAEALRDVKYWLTINEPTVLVKNGFVAGAWPPFKTQSPLAAIRVLRSLARGHVAAYEQIHDIRDDAQVGFAHSAPYIVPCRPGNLRDETAAAVRDFALNDLLFLLVNRYGRKRRLSKPFDYIGLNYYSRTIVRSSISALSTLFGRECREPHHEDLGGEYELGWLAHPRGIYEVVRKFSRYGVPIIITENGIATNDDDVRAEFLREHIIYLAKAIQDGADVGGYFHWTLVDNFEWAYGPNAHFGLAAIDWNTGTRIPRPSSAVFSDICSANRVRDVLEKL